MEVAILGLGTIGIGIYELIDKSEYLKDIKVKKVLDKDKSKESILKPGQLTDNFEEIVNDDEIKIIFEVMGAKEFSYMCIKRSLENKKHVITANKEVIALYLDELTKIAKTNKVSLMYEASVGGGIFLITPLLECVKINEVKNIVGILNGTTNYILTKMSRENLDFSEALKLAQQKGFAEANPTADLEGLDIVRKITILSMIAYKGILDVEKVYHFGISNIEYCDIIFLKELGYDIKLIGSSFNNNNSIDIAVEPVAVDNYNILSGVNEEFNGIFIEASVNDKLMYYGKGAGRYPTANALINDMIMIMENKGNNYFTNVNKLTIKEDLDKRSEYYIRFNNGNQIITDEITRQEFLSQLDNIKFYARII
ncbi:MAG: homoserine dehydrogenase [Bacilli bacterium]|nr:homoserine dehydrogenase [Bacilli bacterium]